MYSYYTTVYSGRTVHIIKAQSDSAHDVCISVMAERYDSADPLKLASDFGDGYLESSGFSKVGVINGGIFNTPYANGIEVAFWSIHENDDTALDGVMGIAHGGDASNSLIVNTQSGLKGSIGSYRGAITGAFGLLKDGAVNQGNTSAQGAYSSVSGRSIIGSDASGAIYFIATAGVTGTSGLTGSQCVGLAQSLGLTNAVALDGGGSVSLIYEGSWKVSTTRQVKNVIGLYVKPKSDPGGGGGEDPNEQRFSDNYTPTFDQTLPHKIMIGGMMVPIKDIQVKTSSGMVSIRDIEEQ